MTTAAEAAAAKSQLAADLAAGVNTLSLDQTITFTRYVRLVLPLDGYVFWINSEILSASALLNTSHFNTNQPNQAAHVVTPAATLTAKGSFHFSSDVHQEEEETYTGNAVVFTSEVLVNDLSSVGENSLYIATYQGMRIAFNSRGRFYKQADLYHYTGFAVYADMLPQIIDSPLQLDTQNVIVSNSLPIWLYLNNYTPTSPAYGFGNSIQLYPSFLSPRNMTPPYGVVHIMPDGTQAIASAPTLAQNSSHAQLARDRVKITFWGLRNFSAQDFIDCVYQFSQDYDYIGLTNTPIVRDEKRSQTDLLTLAMKKSVEFEVTYYQTRANQVARQLIAQAIPSFAPRPFNLPQTVNVVPQI